MLETVSGITYQDKAIVGVSRRLNIYLAGKVGGHKWEAVADVNGVHTFTSSDGNDHSAHLWGVGCDWTYDDEAHQQFVIEYALEPIRRSDLIIAYLDTPDSFGSIAEIAYASAHRKPILMVLVDPPLAGFHSDDVAAEQTEILDAYWFIAAFPGVTPRRVYSSLQAQNFLTGILTPRAAAWTFDPATPKQRDYLLALGYRNLSATLTKGEAGEMIAAKKRPRG